MRLFRTVEIAAADLRTADPQFAGGADREPATAVVDHVEPQVVERVSDRDVRLFLPDVEDGREDGAFRGAVAVVEGIGRRIDRHEFLTAYRQVLQSRIAREVTGEHHAHLRGHEAVGDAVVGDEGAQFGHVVPRLFRNDVDVGAAGQGGVEVHHTGVKAETGVGSHAAVRGQVIVVPVPGAEIHQVAVLQHTAFRHTG